MGKRKTELEQQSKKKKNELYNKVIKAIEDGPDWSFCPHLNQSCRYDCVCLERPYFREIMDGMYESSVKWNCWHNRPLRLVGEISQQYRDMSEGTDVPDGYTIDICVKSF